MSPGQVTRSAFESEFFVGEEDSEGFYGRTDGLVREAVQNTLDARLEGQTAHVRLWVGDIALLPRRKHAAAVFNDLIPHLAGIGIDLAQDGTFPSPMRTFVYEDFSTRGLCGEVDRNRPVQGPDIEQQDFYYFWRTIGLSGKTGDELGRWGLGKSVLPATSRSNTMLGLTVRATDKRRLVMGQAVLGPRWLGETAYAPEAFFHGGQSKSGVPLPIDDHDFIDSFSEFFRLTRQPDETGLSIVVPFAAENLSAIELLRSVILHFFVPILRGNLTAEVSGPALPPTYVNDASIRDVAAQLKWAGSVSTKKHAPPPFDFATWAIVHQRARALPELHRAGVGGAPRWNESLFPEEILPMLQQRFTSGEPIAIRVPMQIELKNGSTEDSYFDAFLQRDENLERGEDHYIREGMTISHVSALRARRNLCGLLFVDDKPLSALLGDAEGPAHTDWGTGESRPDRNYVRWKWRVSFVKNALAKITEYLTPPPQELDPNLLADVFYVDDTDDTCPAPIAPEDEGETPSPVKPGDIRPPKRWYKLTGQNGGFRVARSRESELPSNPRLQISVAYDVPSGNPLTSWSPFDFEFRDGGPIQLRGHGLQVKRRNGNVLECRASAEDFALKVVGFDPIRDLYVRVEELTSEEEEAEESEAIALNGVFP